MKGPLFYSKILLFGEYGIIKDSKGLSIPYNFYNGALKITNVNTPFAKDSNSKLLDFYDYLKNLNNPLVNFNLDKFYRDLKLGMYFDSSIPKGYGVGSSGALVAAVYDYYANDKITILENLTREKLLKLKEVFFNYGIFFSW
jgi:mevalonate kinase